MDGSIDILAETPVLPPATDSHPSPSEQSIFPNDAPESNDSLQVEEDSNLPQYLKDVKYYLEFVTLLVGDCIFMVPKYHFMRYDQFNWMWDTDEETPHKLHDIEKADFRAFMKFLHPMYLPNQPPMTTDEWVSVLKIASKWMLLDIREAAKKALDTRPWLHKITLARTFGVVPWLRDGYFYYASREESLSVEDVQGLGVETAFKLITIRDGKLQRSREAFQKDVHPNSILSLSFAVDKELSGELEGVQAVHGDDAVERVLWARSRNDLGSLRLAYIDLVERKESISSEHALKLGLETTVNLCRARQRWLNIFPELAGKANQSPSDLWIEIDGGFKEELDLVTSLSALYAPQRTPPPVCHTNGEKKNKK
ncbi:hypothetical protein J132_04986 [Termitomyces sp. J132]|nr:hypothetical protein J132_04986 [Termitomyces sp. J132]